MPSPLSITTNQNSLLTLLADVVTGTVAEAQVGGVNAPGPTQIIAPIFSSAQWASLTTAQKQLSVDMVRAGFAALLVAMNIDRIGLGTAGAPKVISFMKPDSSTGTMTFVGGLLVAST